MVLRNALENLAVSSSQTITTTRLEEIKDALDVLEASGAKNAQLIQIRDFVDTVEGLLVTLAAVDFATQTTLAAVLVKLNDIFGAVDGLEVTAENIEFSAETVSLNTDEVEDLLRQLRDRIGNTGSAADATGTLTQQLRALHGDLGLLLTDTQLAARLGTAGAAPDLTGTALAQLRAIGDLLQGTTDEIGDVEVVLTTIRDRTPDGAAELVARLLSKTPASGFRLAFDTADANHLYTLESLAGTGVGATGWRGIRVPIDVLGNPIGVTQVNNSATLTFNNRKTDPGWT